MSWLLRNFDWPLGQLAVRLRLRSEVNIHDLRSGGISLTHLWGSNTLENISPIVADSLKEMTKRWIDKNELWSLTVANVTDGWPLDNIAHFSELVSLLDQLNFLCRLQLVFDHEPLATIDPLSPNSSLEFSDNLVGQLRLSRFAYLQRSDDGLAMESAIAPHRILLHNKWGIGLLSHLTRGGSITSIMAEYPTSEFYVGRALIELLDATGMLDGREHNLAMGIGDDLIEMCEFHDLLFHRRSRFGLHDQPFGATFPYIENIPPLPAFTPLISPTVVKLPVPTESVVLSSDITLTQAIERRTSVRHYGTDALTLAQLAEFLYRCARVRAHYGPAPDMGTPYEASDRPYPSGGGIYDLELYILANNVEGLQRGIYHYAADRHILEDLDCREENIWALLQAAMRASNILEPPQVLITITSRFGRMSWKYRSISYATTLKNVGVLYQTMYLVATAMRLGACALGSGNDSAAQEGLGLAFKSEISVGEFMIGTLPRDSDVLAQNKNIRKHPTWHALLGLGWGKP